jgi:hypothetical protein
MLQPTDLLFLESQPTTIDAHIAITIDVQPRTNKIRILRARCVGLVEVARPGLIILMADVGAAVTYIQVW